MVATRPRGLIATAGGVEEEDDDDGGGEGLGLTCGFGFALTGGGFTLGFGFTCGGGAVLPSEGVEGVEGEVGIELPPSALTSSRFGLAAVGEAGSRSGLAWALALLSFGTDSRAVADSVD